MSLEDISDEALVERLFGFQQREFIPRRRSWERPLVAAVDPSQLWRRPLGDLPLDAHIEHLNNQKRKGSIRLRSREEFRDPLFCPYYDTRLYVMEAVAAAREIPDKVGSIEWAVGAMDRDLEKLSRAITAVERLFPIRPYAWLHLIAPDVRGGVLDAHEIDWAHKEFRFITGAIGQAGPTFLRALRELHRFWNGAKRAPASNSGTGAQSGRHRGPSVYSASRALFLFLNRQPSDRGQCLRTFCGEHLPECVRGRGAVSEPN